MWLVGVVIRRYIDILIIIINFPYSTCIRSFFGSSILTSLFILKMFFRSLYINIAKIRIPVIQQTREARSARQLFIYFRPYVTHVPLTRFTSRPVEVQWSIIESFSFLQ